MQLFKLSESTAARRRFYFTAVLSSNVQSRITGLTSGWTINVDQNGTSSSGAGTFTQVSSTNYPGVYYYEATAGELATLGPVVLYIANTGAGMEPRELAGQVVAFDPYDAASLGLSTLSGLAAAIFATVTEGTTTFLQAIRLITAGIAGSATGFATGSQVYTSLDGTKNRIQATVTTTGRTVTARDAS